MQRSPASPPARPFPQVLDRLALTVMLLLALVIAALLFLGNRTAPSVRSFSWQNKDIGANDVAFVLTFSRPMDQATVDQNLKIEPPLLGKSSWAGRRMAYTLTMPAPYGTQYSLTLENALDFFDKSGTARLPIQPFQATFKTRDRAFAYIGVQGEEAGRLVLFNITKQERLILTPSDLIVNDFKPYPLGDRILIAATERSKQAEGIVAQKLYQVATGLQVDPPVQIDPDTKNRARPTAANQPVGTLELVLDSDSYQNLKFDLSADGNIIIVQRVNRQDPADFGPWLLKTGEAPQPLKGQPGGDFLITPDSDALAIAQGQGLAILPLYPDAKPLDFLPKFGIVLNFSRDGGLAATVKFNSDRTRSLYVVSNQGTQKELLRTEGSIFSAQFDPTSTILYCLLSKLIPGETYREEPYLAAINTKNAKLTRLLPLPNQREAQISLSPDGLAILYDQTTATQTTDPNTLRNQSGQTVADSRLWILPLETDNLAKSKPEALPIPGLRPRWLP